MTEVRNEVGQVFDIIIRSLWHLTLRTRSNVFFCVGHILQGDFNQNHTDYDQLWCF